MNQHEPNNSINSLTTFAGTHTRGAASPLCPTCLRPLLKSYVHMKIQILSVLLLLNGCSSIDNKIGYGVNFEIPIEASCLISTINEYEPFQPVTTLGSSLEFTYLENSTSLSLHSKSLIGGYQLTIDGMFLGKSHQQFVQEAEQTSKLVQRLVNLGCS